MSGEPNKYTCTGCGDTGVSFGVRPSGWGMEVTAEPSSVWRRWCPPCRDRREEDAPETLRPPASEPASGPGAPDPHTDRGTGVPGLEIPAQAIDGRPLTAPEIISRTLVLMVGTSRHDRTELREIADELAETLRAVHYRDAAKSLRDIADHMPDTASAEALRPGIEYAATLLRHTADGMGDTDGTA